MSVIYWLLCQEEGPTFFDRHPAVFAAVVVALLCLGGLIEGSA